MATSNREAVIELGGRIATLRAQFQKIKMELRSAESDLDRLLSTHTPPTPPSIARQSEVTDLPQGSDHDGGEISLNQRIVQLLDGEPDREFDTGEILARLDGAQVASVRSALVRLASQGKIRKPSRGSYTSTVTHNTIVGQNGETVRYEE